MIEGVIVGLTGAGIAVGILLLGKVTIVDPLADDFALVDNLSTIGFAPLVAMLVGCRGRSSRRSAAASRCAASCGFERRPAGAGASAPAVVIGLVAGLAVAVVVGIADRLLLRATRATTRWSQARDVIEDHYFHDPVPAAAR